jgi:hypothetical protein
VLIDCQFHLTPGQKKAVTPKAIAARPRSSSSHQLSASVLSWPDPATDIAIPESIRVLDIVMLLRPDSWLSMYKRAPPGRPLMPARYLAYSNGGLAFSASLVAPARTSLSSTNLSCATGTATSCLVTARNPPALMMAYEIDLRPQIKLCCKLGAPNQSRARSRGKLGGVTSQPV